MGVKNKCVCVYKAHSAHSAVLSKSCHDDLIVHRLSGQGLGIGKSWAKGSSSGHWGFLQWEVFVLHTPSMKGTGHHGKEASSHLALHRKERHSLCL